jgi:hypothetical protein
MRTTVFAILILLLTSCAGVLVSTSEDHEIENPRLEGAGKSLSYSGSSEIMTKNELLEKWGEPLSIEKLKNGSEIWEYELDEKIEKDMSLMIGIFPITINLPDETKKIIFTISDGLVIKAKTKIGKTNGAVCGLVPTQHFGVKLGCTQ